MATQINAGTVTVNTQQAQANINKLAKSLEMVNPPLGRIDSNFREFEKSLDAATARVVAFTTTTGLIYGMSDALQRVTRDAIEVEAAMTKVQAILKVTDNELASLKTQLFAIANNTGQTFSEASKALEEFARQGLNAEKTLKATEAALIVARLSGANLEETINGLVATVSSFSNELLDYGKVANTLVGIDARFSTSAAGLIEGIKRVGTVASDAGITFEELGSAIAAVRQVTGRSESVIGNGLKTIFTNLQTDKVQKELSKLGIETKTATGQFLPLIQVVDQLAGAFQKLTDAQRADLGLKIAGKYQINTFKALIQSFGAGETSLFDQALQTARSSQDEAIKRNELLNQTTLSSLNRLDNAITQLGASFGDKVTKPLVKGFAEAAKTALDTISGVFKDSPIGDFLAGGIVSALKGPGLLLAVVAIGKLTKRITKELGDAIASVSGLNAREKENLTINQAIISALQNENDERVRAVRLATTLEEKQRAINNLISAYYPKVAKSTAGSYENLVTPALRKQIMQSPNTPKLAGGYLPNMASGFMKEQVSIAKGVGGARNTARAVPARINMSRGSTPVIVNTDEHIIRNFKNSGQDAVFNRDMTRSVGGVSNLRKFGRVEKVMASGYVPSAGKLPAYRSIRDYPFVPTIGETYGMNPKKIDFIRSIAENITGFRTNPILFRDELGGDVFGEFRPKYNAVALSKKIFANKSDPYNKTYHSPLVTAAHEYGHFIEEAGDPELIGIFKKLHKQDIKKSGSLLSSLNKKLGRDYTSAYKKQDYFSESFANTFGYSFLDAPYREYLLRDRSMTNLMQSLIMSNIPKNMANGFVPNFNRKSRYREYEDDDDIDSLLASIDLPEGYLQNSELSSRAIRKGKSPNSFIRFTADRKNKVINIEDMESHEKGDAFTGFKKIAEFSKRNNFNIKTQTLVKQVNRETKGLTGMDLVYTMFPQLRNHEGVAKKTSGEFEFRGRAIKFDTLDSLRSIIGTMSPDEIKSIPIFRNIQDNFAGGIIPNFARMSPEDFLELYKSTRGSKNNARITKEGRLYSPGARRIIQSLTEGEKLSPEKRILLDKFIEKDIPIEPIDVQSTLKNLPNSEQIRNALIESGKKRDVIENMIPISSMIAGEKAETRQDVPSQKLGIGVVTTTQKIGSNNKTSYGSFVRIKNPYMIPSSREQTIAMRIGQGATKQPTIKVQGTLHEDQRIPDLTGWAQVGFNPDRHSYYYDRVTKQPVIGGEEGVQIGNTIFVKKPKYGNPEDFAFANGYIPNFAKSQRLGEGMYGTFYKLKGGVGKKRFKLLADNKRIVEEYMYYENLSKPEAEKKAQEKIKKDYEDVATNIKNEYRIAKFLNQKAILPQGVSAPKVIGTLERSLAKNRIGKEVVQGDTLGNVNLNYTALSSFRDFIINSIESNNPLKAYDLHYDNMMLNTKGIKMANRYKPIIEKVLQSYDTTNPGKYTDRFEYKSDIRDRKEKVIKRMLSSLAKRGGNISIVDPGSFQYRGTEALANGYIPNFNTDSDYQSIISELHRLSPSQRLKFAKSNFRKLGKGSSRIAYDIGGRALKLPLNEAGIAQNRVETDPYMFSSFARPVLPTIFDEGPDDEFLTMQLAQKFNDKKFKNLVGVSLNQLRAELPRLHDPRAKILPFKQFPNEYRSGFHSIVEEGLISDDLHSKNLGIVTEPDYDSLFPGQFTKDRPVILDYGFTQDVADQYYRRRNLGKRFARGFIPNFASSKNLTDIVSEATIMKRFKEYYEKGKDYESFYSVVNQSAKKAGISKKDFGVFANITSALSPQVADYIAAQAVAPVFKNYLDTRSSNVDDYLDLTFYASASKEDTEKYRKSMIKQGIIPTDEELSNYKTQRTISSLGLFGKGIGGKRKGTRRVGLSKALAGVPLAKEESNKTRQYQSALLGDINAFPIDTNVLQSIVPELGKKLTPNLERQLISLAQKFAKKNKLPYGAAGLQAAIFKGNTKFKDQYTIDKARDTFSKIGLSKGFIPNFNKTILPRILGDPKGDRAVVLSSYDALAESFGGGPNYPKKYFGEGAAFLNSGGSDRFIKDLNANLPKDVETIFAPLIGGNLVTGISGNRIVHNEILTQMPELNKFLTKYLMSRKSRGANKITPIEQGLFELMKANGGQLSIDRQTGTTSTGSVTNATKNLGEVFKVYKKAIDREKGKKYEGSRILTDIIKPLLEPDYYNYHYNSKGSLREDRNYSTLSRYIKLDRNNLATKQSPHPLYKYGFEGIGSTFIERDLTSFKDVFTKGLGLSDDQFKSASGAIHNTRTMMGIRFKSGSDIEKMLGLTNYADGFIPNFNLGAKHFIKGKRAEKKIAHKQYIHGLNKEKISQIREAFKNLNKLRKKSLVDIKKADYDHFSGKNRYIGLSKPLSAMDSLQKMKQVLFAYAHEFAHSSQLIPDRLEDKLGKGRMDYILHGLYNKYYNSETGRAENPFDAEWTLKREQDAWYYGENFIPKDFLDDYKVSAKKAYSSYDKKFNLYPDLANGFVPNFNSPLSRYKNLSEIRKEYKEFKALEERYKGGDQGAKEQAQIMIDMAAMQSGNYTKAYHATSSQFTSFSKSFDPSNGFWLSSKDLRQKIGSKELLSLFIKGTPKEWKSGESELKKAFRRYPDMWNDAPSGVFKTEDMEYGGTSYLVKSPYQIKSTEPFTYNQKGKLIPPFRRFDSRNPDINYAGGFIPNFAKPQELGRGAYGTFYKLRNKIGKKSFGKYGSDEMIENEYKIAKFLNEKAILPSGVSAPKIIGNLERSLVKKRIGKEVIEGEELQHVSRRNFDNMPILSFIKKSIEQNNPLDVYDLHGGNVMLNKKGIDIASNYSDLIQYMLSKYDNRKSTRPLRDRLVGRMLSSFARRGGELSIVDPGLFEFNSSKQIANGFIPNFADYDMPQIVPGYQNTDELYRIDANNKNLLNLINNNPKLFLELQKSRDNFQKDFPLFFDKKFRVISDDSPRPAFATISGIRALTKKINSKSRSGESVLYGSGLLGSLRGLAMGGFTSGSRESQAQSILQDIDNRITGQGSRNNTRLTYSEYSKYVPDSILGRSLNARVANSTVLAEIDKNDFFGVDAPNSSGEKPMSKYRFIDTINKIGSDKSVQKIVSLIREVAPNSKALSKNLLRFNFVDQGNLESKSFKNAIGLYRTISDNIDIANETPIKTLVHEAGHLLDLSDESYFYQKSPISRNSVLQAISEDAKKFGKHPLNIFRPNNPYPSNEYDVETIANIFENDDVESDNKEVNYYMQSGQAPRLIKMAMDSILSNRKFGSKGSISFANGFIPNFNNPLKQSINREVEALVNLGYPKSMAAGSVKIGTNERLKNKANPMGLGVYNLAQGQFSLGQAIGQHSTQSQSEKFVPNFAATFTGGSGFGVPATTTTTTTTTSSGTAGAPQPPGSKNKKPSKGQKAKQQKLINDFRLAIRDQEYGVDPLIVQEILDQFKNKIPESIVKKELAGFRQREAQAIERFQKETGLFSFNRKVKRVASNLNIAETSNVVQKRQNELSEKRGRGLTAAAFGIPFAAGGIVNAIGGQDTKAGRITMAVSEAAGTLALGAQFGALGLVVSGVAAGLQLLNGVAKEFRPNLEELSKKSQELSVNNEKQLSSMQRYSEALGQLKSLSEGGASPVLIAQAKNDLSQAAASVGKRYSTEFLGAKTDEERVAIMQQATLSAQREQAAMDTRLLSASVIDKEYKGITGGFNQLVSNKSNIGISDLSTIAAELTKTVDISKISAETKDKLKSGEATLKDLGINTEQINTTFKEVDKFFKDGSQKASDSILKLVQSLVLMQKTTDDMAKTQVDAAAALGKARESLANLIQSSFARNQIQNSNLISQNQYGIGKANNILVNAEQSLSPESLIRGRELLAKAEADSQAAAEKQSLNTELSQKVISGVLSKVSNAPLTKQVEVGNLVRSNLSSPGGFDPTKLALEIEKVVDPDTAKSIQGELLQVNIEMAQKMNETNNNLSIANQKAEDLTQIAMKQLNDSKLLNMLGGYRSDIKGLLKSIKVPEGGFTKDARGLGEPMADGKTANLGDAKMGTIEGERKAGQMLEVLRARAELIKSSLPEQATESYQDTEPYVYTIGEGKDAEMKRGFRPVTKTREYNPRQRALEVLEKQAQVIRESQLSSQITLLGEQEVANPLETLYKGVKGEETKKLLKQQIDKTKEMLPLGQVPQFNQQMFDLVKTDIAKFGKPGDTSLTSALAQYQEGTELVTSLTGSKGAAAKLTAQEIVGDKALPPEFQAQIEAIKSNNTTLNNNSASLNSLEKVLQNLPQKIEQLQKLTQLQFESANLKTSIVDKQSDLNVETSAIQKNTEKEIFRRNIINLANESNDKLGFNNYGLTGRLTDKAGKKIDNSIDFESFIRTLEQSKTMPTNESELKGALKQFIDSKSKEDIEKQYGVSSLFGESPQKRIFDMTVESKAFKEMSSQMQKDPSIFNPANQNASQEKVDRLQREVELLNKRIEENKAKAEELTNNQVTSTTSINAPITLVFNDVGNVDVNQVKAVVYETMQQVNKEANQAPPIQRPVTMTA